MLEVDGLQARYGQALVLEDVSFTVRQGSVCLLLGRNGAGKSTTLKALMGLVRPARGAVRFRGTDVAGEEPYRIARRGVGYVPEERRIFTDLTVLENLEVGARAATEGAAWTPERLFALFPNLAEMRHRAAGRMSGGEQQMLAIARTLMGNPRLLLLDEPSEGLSPLIVEQLAETLKLLKREGTTMLLAEQNLHFARLIGDDAVLLERGRVVWFGSAAALAADAAAQARFLAL
ncbi:MAG: ABC transporter ATP-binding protein [Acetobacteraceae bacterium]|nr:ABC transporter ATP-binding protein [Acetobacteraceae bacterium]